MTQLILLFLCGASIGYMVCSLQHQRKMKDIHDQLTRLRNKMMEITKNSQN